MQKRHSGLWLTSCSKPRPFCHQHHAEKACGALTYILFKTQSSPLSGSCKTDLLDTDLHAVENPEQPIVRIMQKRPLGPQLTSCWKPKQPIVSVVQERPSDPHLHTVQKSNAHCQHHAEKAFWTPNPDLQAVQNPEKPIVSIMQKEPSWLWLTACS